MQQVAPELEHELELEPGLEPLLVPLPLPVPEVARRAGPELVSWLGPGRRVSQLAPGQLSSLVVQEQAHCRDRSGIFVPNGAGQARGGRRGGCC